MYRDNSSTNLNRGTQSLHALYRGLYVRIARKLDVDPSYVSRVARGDRRSSEVENALRQAQEEINQQLERGSSDTGRRRSASSAERLGNLVKGNGWRTASPTPI
jgi:hypothetical protein